MSKSKGGKKMTGATRVRSAISGQFVKKGTEKRSPSTTVVEKVRPTKKR